MSKLVVCGEPDDLKHLPLVKIPPGFTRDLRAGRTARIQVLIDGSNSSIASSSLNTSLNVGFRKAMLELAARTGVRDLPVEVRPQILDNPEMRSPNFFVPGVIGLIGIMQ